MIPIIDRPENPEDGHAGGPEDPENPEASRQPPTQQEIQDELAREILRIHDESYGRGARSPKAIFDGDWVIVLLGDLELLPNEKFLVENGKADSVTQVRTQYQLAIQSCLRAAVERATGRTVIGFTSTTSVEEPRFVAEVFKLR